jgi:trehalose-6-phosphatase
VETIRDAVRELTDVRTVGGVKAVNLLPRGGADKGVALQRARRMFACDTVVYVGDDETDEDAFEEISKDGMALRVGDPTHPGAVLGAGGLPSPEAVVTFLERWLSVIEGIPSPEAASR